MFDVIKRDPRIYVIKYICKIQHRGGSCNKAECLYVQEAEETASEEEVRDGHKARGGAEQNPAAPREGPLSGSICWPEPRVHGDE